MASLENEIKLEKFENEIKDENAMNKKLKILFLNEYDELISDILNLKDDLFIDQVKEGVSLLLEDFYTISCLSDETLTKLIQKNLNEITEKYNHDYKLIDNAVTSYEKTSNKRMNNDNILSGFRKHCIHTDDFASHNCCTDEKDGEIKSHFIIVNESDESNSIKFVVCENCKKVYYSSFILAHCFKCGVDYHTSLLSPEENPDFLYATWEKYHCKQIMNERMKCIKCNQPFYLNMKSGFLTCLNKKCECVLKPTRILWTCNICKTEFKSGAIPYNPLDIIVTKKLVSQTLLLRHKAHPNKMPCCKINVFFTDFYHKHNCDGILYESELDDNKIVVCEKCKAINFYERFYWTCPKCGKRFKDKLISSSNESPRRKSIKEKEEIKEEKKHKKEKQIEEIEKRKIKTPKPEYGISKLRLKKEKELNEFKLNTSVKEDNENDNNNNNNKEDEKIKIYNSPKRARNKYHRFNLYSKEDKNEDKSEDRNEDKNEEKKENEEKNEDNDYDNKIIYRRKRIRTAFDTEEKKALRKLKYENENNDKNIKEQKEKEKQDEEKEVKEAKSKEKEKKPEYRPERMSPRIQYKKRREMLFNKKELKEFCLSNEKEKSELEEKERKEKEEKERKEREEREREEREEKERKEREEKERKEIEEKEREEKERKEREEKERKEREEKEEEEKREKEEKENEVKKMNKEGNISGRGWFRRLAAEREKGTNSINSLEKKETVDKSTKSSKKEKDTESIDNDEESEGNNSIDNYDPNNIMKFGKDENDEDEKEKRDNPSEPDPLYMNYKFKRRYNRKGTHGMEIEGDQDQEEHKKEEENKERKKKNNQQIKIPMSKIPGVSEHLFNHINKRMNKILDRCKIPIFNIDDYIFNKKLGEGSYAVIFSVSKKDDKEHHELALKKILAKTLTEIDKYTKEFELVHSCIHPNIMKIYGICIRMLDQTTYALYVLMELSYCDWDKEIKAHILQKKYYSERRLINILRQLTDALLFMQQKLKISHRDIKPQNVLLFKDGFYKIADFGEAKEAKLSKQMNTLRGTELYMSPALYSGLKNERNDVNHDPYKSDVFSLGFCFLYAASLNFNLLYQAREIFNSKTMNDILQKHLHNIYSQTFISILSKMMEIDEIDRFDFPKIINYIEENYDKDGNLKNPEKTNVNVKKHESSYRIIQ